MTDILLGFVLGVVLAAWAFWQFLMKKGHHLLDSFLRSTTRLDMGLFVHDEDTELRFIPFDNLRIALRRYFESSGRSSLPDETLEDAEWEIATPSEPPPVPTKSN
jgi:hypothetical protein